MKRDLPPSLWKRMQWTAERAQARLQRSREAAERAHQLLRAVWERQAKREVEQASKNGDPGR